MEEVFWTISDGLQVHTSCGNKYYQPPIPEAVFSCASLRLMHNSSPSVMLYCMPYSEHRFAEFLPPQMRT